YGYDGIEIVVTEFQLAEQRGLDVRRRGDVKHRTVRRRLRDVGDRLRAAAAGAVLDDKIDAHDRPKMLDQLAGEDVAAAAGARMGDERDRALRIFRRRRRDRYGRDGHDGDRGHEQKSTRAIHVSSYASGLLFEQRARRSRLFRNGAALRLRLFISADRDDLGDGAAGRTELDRNDARIADDLAAVFLDFADVLVHVVHFDGEVMDAGTGSGGEGFRRFLGVVFDEREVDGAVGQMARGMVANLLRARRAKAENRFVKPAGAV